MVEVDLKEVKTLKKGLEKYNRKVMKTVRAYGESSATTLQNEAKRRAKWIDRTGQARNSITGTYLEEGESLGIIRLEGYAKKGTTSKKLNLSSSSRRRVSLKKGTGSYRAAAQNYFKYLEYAHQGKYKILRPTAEKASSRISKVMARRIAKIKIMTE